MKEIFLALLVFTATVALATGQTPARSNSKSKPEIPARSIIRGRIVYEGTGLPVRRGSVGLMKISETEPDTSAFRGYSIEDVRPQTFALTNDNGEFEIRNVVKGTYYPFVNVPNVINPHSINRYYGKNITIASRKFDGFFQRISVDGYSAVQVLVGVKRGAAISGRVQYSDGTPAILVKVRIFRSGTESGEGHQVTVSSTETDDRGSFRVTDLPPGKFYVELIEPALHRNDGGEMEMWSDVVSGSELKTFFPNTTDLKRAEPIELDWGQERSEVDVVIAERKLFRVSGVIIAKDTQKPMSNITANFQRIEKEDDNSFFGGSSRNEVVSDQLGNFSFSDLPKGKYRLKISPGTPNSFDSSIANQVTYAESIREFEITDTDLTDLNIEMPRESVVSGFVEFEGGKPIPSDFGVYIYLIDRKRKTDFSGRFPGYSQREVSNARSQLDFRLGSLPAGSYSFQIARDDGYYVKNITFGSNDLTNSDLEIKEGQSVEKVKVTLATDIGKLKGIVFIEKDIPAQFSTIILVPVDSARRDGSNSYFWGLTNSKGDFEIPAAPGEYFLSISDRSDSDLSRDEYLQKLIKNAQKVTIKPNETTTVSAILPKK